MTNSLLYLLAGLNILMMTVNFLGLLRILVLRQRIKDNEVAYEALRQKYLRSLYP